MRLPRRMLLWALIALPALLAVACLSPTLPLPPPAPPEVEQIGQGQYRLTGTIPVPGTVLVLDESTSYVFGKYTKSAYSLTVAANAGDTLRVWYEAGEDVSDYAEFEIDRALAVPDAGAPPARTGDAGDAGTD